MAIKHRGRRINMAVQSIDSVVEKRNTETAVPIGLEGRTIDGKEIEYMNWWSNRENYGLVTLHKWDENGAAVKLTNHIVFPGRIYARPPNAVAVKFKSSKGKIRALYFSENPEHRNAFPFKEDCRAWEPQYRIRKAGNEYYEPKQYTAKDLDPA